MLTNSLFNTSFAEHGYYQTTTPSLYRHLTRPIAFCLVVDDFGVKYVGKEHALHLQTILAQKYKITTDWNGALYCGIALDWNYHE